MKEKKSRSRWGWWRRLWEKLQGWWLLVVVRYLGLGRPRSIPPTSDSFHKILCLGDGTVEGWGDVWRLGRFTAGFPARLQDLLDETDKIRQHWVVINRGHYGATTDDWLPDAAHKPSVGPAQWVERTLWRDVMDDPKVNDAEVVLLGLGSMDNLYGEDPKSASHTVDNIIVICGALKDLRKVVFVSPIPAGREVERGHKRRNLERNVLLWEFLQAQQQQLDPSQESMGAIYPGPGWQGRHGRDMYASDFLHFNSQGYQMRAEEWGNVLLQPLLRIEWRSWQKLIKPSRPLPPPSSDAPRRRR